jgi:hypothetical protein
LPRAAAGRKPRTRRRTWWLSGCEFRELRLSCLLNQRACAEFLGVGIRTVRGWDHGRSRVPWSVIRLLRITRNGELLPAAWAGWRLWGDTLWSPEGKGYRAHELAAWGLLVGMARLFREQQRRTRLSAGGALVVVKPVADACPPPLAEPLFRPVPMDRNPRAGAAGAGLVSIRNNGQAEFANGVALPSPDGAGHPGRASSRAPGQPEQQPSSMEVLP